MKPDQELTTPEDNQPLSPAQIQLMAWVDGELSTSERLEFEQKMASDSELAMQAAQLKGLTDLTSSAALAEPSDVEMRRFWNRFYNRTEWQLGWMLLLVGVLVLAGQGLYLLCGANVSWWLKGAVLSVLAGGALLLWNTLRLKLRTSRFDRYRGVLR